MSDSSRRDFLKLTASSLACLAGSVSLWAPNPLLAADARREFLMFCDTDRAFNIRGTNLQTDPGTIKGLDVVSGENFAIDIPFFGHAIIQNPALPHQFFTLEKWGRRGALVDTQTKKILSSIENEQGNVFFGHGSYTQDGAFFMTSESTYDQDEGAMVVRDTKTLQIVRSIPIYGYNPHECRLLQDGKTILIANQGSPRHQTLPNLAWIDYDTGKLLKSIEVTPPLPAGAHDKSFDGSFAHFDVAHDNWICCGGAGSSSAKDSKANDLNDPHAVIGFISPQGKVCYPNIPPRLVPHMLGEGLSVNVLGQTGLCAITISEGNLCLVFDYKTQELKHVIHLAKVKGVLPLRDTPDAGNGVILLSQHRLSQADFRLGSKPIPSAYNTTVHGRGAHIARIYI